MSKPGEDSRDTPCHGAPEHPRPGENMPETQRQIAGGGVDSGTVTHLLMAWGDGDPHALDELVSQVYGELLQIADRALRRERSDHTLEPTALVHEAFMRLSNQDRIHWRNRSQLMGVVGELMRRILVDHARRRRADKRDGGIRLTLQEGLAPGREDRIVDLLMLDDALTRLQALDPRQAKIVELRYFAGLKVEETAEALDLSTRTVKREWAMARAWLKRELTRGR